MKIVTAICLFLFATVIHAQEKEIEAFKKDFNFYLDFQLNKFESIPINPANQALYSKKVDASFRAFVSAPNSQNYDQLVVSKDGEKFYRLDSRFSITLKTITINDIVYGVYSYTSQNKSNYFIKDTNTNTIVYEGNSNIPYIDTFYKIDNQHMLLIEKNGDFNASRKAIVLSTEKKNWKPLQAFKGYDLGNSFNDKAFQQKRGALVLECDKETTLIAPKDINQISFDPKSKTISYKQYENTSKFKTISAQWENNKFAIDDSRVEDSFGSSNTVMPTR